MLHSLHLSFSLILVALAVAGTTAVGFSRLYLGVHYPSDVLGGYLVGGQWIVIGA